MHPELTVRESLELFAGYYRSPREVADTIELAGLSGEGRRSRRAALRRPAATARRGAGADRRPGAALPRRADDGLRPLGATPGVGGGGEPARPRQDRVPDHPLHGGGAGAGGPGGDHRPRRDRGAGLARRAGRSGDAAARISFRLPAGVAGADLPEAARGRRSATARCSCEADDPVPVLHELTAWALERRIPLAGLEVRRPSLEDVYLELTADEREERGRSERTRARPASVPLRPEDLLAQPGVGVLHGDAAGDLPADLRDDLRQRPHRRSSAASRPPPTTCRRSSRLPWSPPRCRAWRSR